MSSAPITVVIPARNESGSIYKVVHECRKSEHVHEVIVSDNASTDDTAILAQKAGARVVECRTAGFGATLKAGFAAARTDWIFKIDADILNCNPAWPTQYWDQVTHEKSLISGQWEHSQEYWALSYLVIQPFVARYFPRLAHIPLLNSGMYLVNARHLPLARFKDGWGFDTTVHLHALAAEYEIKAFEIEPVLDYVRPHSQYLKTAADTIEILIEAAGLTRDEASQDNRMHL